MLRVAFAFETRTLRRSRSASLALIAFLAIGVLALFVGERSVDKWEDALLTAQSAQEDTVVEARAFFSTGESGPEDKPWVNLAQPLWQDWYSGTRVPRTPGALAGIAAGAVDPAPAVFRISRLADPMAAGGFRIENPELAAGAIDLVFVLGLLLPLLIAALGLDVGSREREERLDRFIRVQAGASDRWLVGRMLVVTAIAGGAAALLCLAAGVIGGARWWETGALILAALVYAGLWGGLLLAINARARTVRSSAFAFGALWTLLCVLVPTLSAELAVGRVEADYALAETLEARDARYSSYEKDLERVLPELYARYPELKKAPAAADDPMDLTVSRHVFDALAFAALEKRHADRARVEAEAVRLAERTAWFSPSVAVGLFLERLAGVGPEAATAYRGRLVAEVGTRVRWVVEHAWAKTPLSASDFESLLEAAPAGFRAEPVGLASPLVALLAWAVASWLLGLVWVAREERHV